MTVKALRSIGTLGGVLLLLLLAGGRAGAQGTYVPRPPEPDSVVNWDEGRTQDRRIAPRGSAHPPSPDPHVPHSRSASWGSRDYFAISGDVGLQGLIVTVENGHLGPKTNPRGFWPAFLRGDEKRELYLLAVNELKY